MTEAPPSESRPDRPEPAAPDKASRALALVGTVVLIALGLAWELRWVPTDSGTLALKVLPLVWPLKGLWSYRMQTYRSLSLLVWLYFTEGMVRATSEGGWGRLLAAVEVVLSLWIFAACAWHIRSRLAKGRT